VERIGTLRPQQTPPYQPAAVRFHEQCTDYDSSAFYYDHLQFTSEQPENTVFQISLQLPFHSDLIVKEFAGDITISNVLPWFSSLLTQYHMHDLAPPDNQLHFLKGYALSMDTPIGRIKISHDQPIYIISRKSVTIPFHNAYTRIMHGYYYIRQIKSKPPFQKTSTVSLLNTASQDNATKFDAPNLSGNTVVDLSNAFMYIQSRAGSVRTNTSSQWPMSDSGCELSVFPNLALFVEQTKQRTEIITAKADCSII
jgi:hypothetical protein